MGRIMDGDYGEMTAPQTFTRVGDFRGDFRGTVLKFDREFFRLPGPVEKYGLYRDSEDPYLIIVSNSQPPINLRYNTILTVTSNSLERSFWKSREFEEKTRIGLRNPSLDLANLMQGIGNVFLAFRRNPQGALGLIMAMIQAEANLGKGK